VGFENHTTLFKIHTIFEKYPGEARPRRPKASERKELAAEGRRDICLSAVSARR
jgi:hypothetical protein